MKHATIQQIQLSDEFSLHCIYCGKQILHEEAENAEDYLTPCEHVLYVATDEGFEYRSEFMNKMYGWEGLDYEAVNLRINSNIGRFIKRIKLNEAINFDFGCAPACLSSYIGFWKDPGQF